MVRYIIIGLIGGMIVPWFVQAQGYSQELKDAYQYAYALGITTMPTIEKANMQGTLIRAHMAKMMVNYAKKVVGKTLDTSLKCTFTDIANQSAELQGYIKEACQMGIMGKGITQFRPNDTVTRAEFGTVLSRILRDNLYDGGTPYYKDHLNALKEMNIMKKIDQPEMKEIRGYVMLMLMRVEQGSSSSSLCETPEHQLSCLLGMNTCPSECTTLPPAAGKLIVQKSSQNYSAGDAVYLGSLELKAEEAPITLKSITLQATMQGKIRLEQDGVRITAQSLPKPDGTITFTFPRFQIFQGTPVVVHIISDVQGNSVKITTTSQIVSSATRIEGSFPVVW